MVLNGEAAWLCLMWCNADILFSVLVLHWVTSKDKSYKPSTARSTSLAGLRSAPNRLEQFDFGTRSSSVKKTGITTHISAVASGTEDEDIQKIDLEHAQTDNGQSFPVDRIKVDVAQVVEVETEGEAVVEAEMEGRIANASVGGSQISTTNGDEVPRASHMGTNELV